MKVFSVFVFVSDGELANIASIFDAISGAQSGFAIVKTQVLERRSGDGSEAVELRVIFADALARLTPKQRAVLVLRFFEDCSEARTAEVLGVALGTVKSQTAVALRRLRELAPELSELVQVHTEGGRR